MTTESGTAASPLIPRGVRRAVTAAAAPVIAAGLLAAPPAAADTGAAADLRSDIDAILEDPALAGAVSGVVVRSMEDGEALYGRDGTEALIPASNMKLLTSAAAMEVFGPDHRFTTEVEAASGPGADGRVAGDLYLTGGADPTLTEDAYDALAADVAASGVEAVSGDLVADDSLFDGERLHPDWEAGDEPYYYAAQISALTVAANDDYDTGVVTVTAAPGAAEGDPVDIALAPMADHLTIIDEATTGPAGGTADIAVARQPGTNTFTLSGSVPAGGDAYETLRTVDDPTGHAVRVFADALEAHGVAVEGDVRQGEAPEGAASVAERDSAPLSELMVPFMKLSNNGHAEMLLKAMGARGSGAGTWKSGVAEIDGALDGIGLDTSAVTQTDGSGLARTNTVTADTVADLLTAAADEPWADDWTAALPVAGDPDRMVGGTLTDRMRGTAAEGSVHAKTGTLTGVSALSGYTTDADGERLVFSIINNGHTGGAPLSVQDAIAVRITEHSRSVPTSADRRDDLSAPLSGTPYSEENTAELECTWSGTC